MDNETAPAPRGLISRRHMVIGGLVAAASAVGYARQPVPVYPAYKKGSIDGLFPETIGGWKSTTAGQVVLPPPDSLSDRLYDNLVTRIYVGGGGQPVMLLLAYNNVQDGVLQVHRPEVCYPTGGYILSDTVPVTVDLPGNRYVPGNFFTAEGNSNIEQVMYWTRVGTDFPRTWLEQRIAVVRANLAGITPDGMLFRISTYSDDRAQAQATLERFAGDLERAVPPKLRTILFGQGVA